MSGPRIPVSTYRLQFNQHLRFSDAKDMVAYLHELGITDLYASPLLQAKRGSMHGYDVADPSHLNSELGTDEEFDGLVRELQQHDMGLLLDIVPNGRNERVNGNLTDWVRHHDRYEATDNAER